jgi:diguanylate cyclase (GGDEF)-like protein/PAS domain S-box-containing protein
MLQGTYDYRLVALSVTLAMVAAYAALELAGRVTAAHQRLRWFWLAGGATAMGLGIWSMHYIGMLAFSLPVPVLYQYPTVGLSLLAAIGASAVALFTVSRERMGVGSCMTGTFAMGGGIAAMHYIGMAAMRLPAMMQYSWPIVALSLGVAFAISLVALVLAFRARQEKKTSRRKLLSALIMGSAIPLMHYTAMAAASFYASDVPFSTRYAVRVSSLGIGVISVSSFLVMMLAIGTGFLDRMLALQGAVVTAARDGEARFRMLAEAVPQIVWTALPEQGVDYCNQRWYELTGLSEEQTLGWGWPEALHPDDQPLVLQNWEQAQHSGEPFEMEYRLRDAQGGYRWYLVRANPMRNSAGAIIKWFGACADIDDQMRHQQVLEELVKRHTAALMAANTRLQSEMRERGLTQQELNLQNERMVSELTKRSDRATNLAKMAELLQGCSDLKDAFSVVASMAPKVFPELRCAVLLFDASGERLEVIPIGHALPISGVAPQDCWALRTGRVHVFTVGDQTVAQCRHVESSERSYCCLPLRAHGEAIGVMHLQMIERGELPEPVLALAAMFAEQVGLSVANIRLRQELRDQSIRDPLTGLYNRRYMEEMLERETLRAVRAEQRLGVLMLDLDHFKSFNDTYGHDAGDTVLREAGAFLLKSVRAEDIVCRFGGEEFIVILPVADLRVTQARAERIRSKLRELSILHLGKSLGMVTVSVGVAGLPQHGTSRKELIEAADAALYRAKREGRDRVVVAGAAPAIDSNTNAVAIGKS